MQTYTKEELFGGPEYAGLEPVRGKDTDGLLTTVYRLLGLDEDQRLIITRDLMSNNRTVNFNKKHLPVLDITDAPGATPTERVAGMYSNTRRYRLSGYGWEQNGLLMTVPLVKLLDGSALFAWEVARPGWQNDVTIYDAARHSAEQGVRATVDVSSRRAKEPRHTVRLKGVGTIDWKLVKTEEIDCEDGLYRDLAYNLPEERKTFCAHEIAAYFKLASVMKERGDSTAAKVSPFAYVSQELVDLYKRISRQAQYQYREGDGQRDRRPLNEIETEALLTTYIAEGLGPGFSMKGKLAERSWR